jgi:hypothetical protein
MAMKNPHHLVRLRFPEYADELPEDLDGESNTVAERRYKAHALRCRGKRLADIAAELKCSPATVSRDLEHVRESYRLFVHQDAAEHAAAVAVDLRHIYDEALAAWERSKGVTLEESSSRRRGQHGTFDVAAVKKKQRDGNPAYLREMREAIKLIGILTGVIDKDAVKERGDKAPPVKLVAGIDPVELV